MCLESDILLENRFGLKIIYLKNILDIAICVSAWFYGYYNSKSNDNLPTLTAIAEMSEADVNSL